MKLLNIGEITDLEVFKTLTAGYKISESINSDYAELIEILGVENTLKLFKNFRGCKINCPKQLYKSDFVMKIAASEADKRQREKIAIVCGYTAARVEEQVKQYLNSCRK